MVDAFCQGLKAFISGGDFKKPEFGAHLPGPSHARESAQELLDEFEAEDPFGRGSFFTF